MWTGLLAERGSAQNEVVASRPGRARPSLGVASIADMIERPKFGRAIKMVNVCNWVGAACLPGRCRMPHLPITSSSIRSLAKMQSGTALGKRLSQSTVAAIGEHAFSTILRFWEG